MYILLQHIPHCLPVLRFKCFFYLVRFYFRLGGSLIYTKFCAYCSTGFSFPESEIIYADFRNRLPVRNWNIFF